MIAVIESSVAAGGWVQHAMLIWRLLRQRWWVRCALDVLQAGECSTAVVAGVSLLLKPDSALRLYVMGVLSPSGNMQPFDTAADGMVLSEVATIETEVVGAVAARSISDGSTACGTGLLLQHLVVSSRSPATARETVSS